MAKFSSTFISAAKSAMPGGKLKQAVTIARARKPILRKIRLQKQVAQFKGSQLARRQSRIVAPKQAPMSATAKRRVKPWVYGAGATALVGGGYLYKRRKK